MKFQSSHHPDYPQRTAPGPPPRMLLQDFGFPVRWHRRTKSMPQPAAVKDGSYELCGHTIDSIS